MVVKEIIRQESLGKLGIGNIQDVITFLDSKLLGLKQFKDDDYTHLILWGESERDIYMQQDLKNGYIHIDNDSIWLVLKSKFGFNYSYIQLLTTWYLVDRYNLKGITKGCLYLLRLDELVDRYNLKGITNFTGICSE